MRVVRLVLVGIFGASALVAALVFAGLFVAVFVVFVVLAAILMLISGGKFGKVSVRASTNRPPARPGQPSLLRTDDAIDVVATKLPADRPGEKPDLLGK